MLTINSLTYASLVQNEKYFPCFFYFPCFSYCCYFTCVKDRKINCKIWESLKDLRMLYWNNYYVCYAYWNRAFANRLWCATFDSNFVENTYSADNLVWDQRVKNSFQENGKVETWKKLFFTTKLFFNGRLGQWWHLQI